MIFAVCVGSTAAGTSTKPRSFKRVCYETSASSEASDFRSVSEMRFRLLVVRSSFVSGVDHSSRIGGFLLSDVV